MNPSTLAFAKGVADVGIGLILFAKPAMLYESVATKALSSFTGLYLTDASTTLGFNHSIACLVASVGLGNLVAARSGPAALPPIFAMTAAWSGLSLLTCLLAPKEWGQGLYAMEKNPPEGPIPVVDTPGDEPCAKICWRGNMNGMLIFAGLFSAILTAFIIESYKTLQPDWSMACIAQQTLNSTKSLPPIPPHFALPCDKFAENLVGNPTTAASLACNILCGRGNFYSARRCCRLR
ncbi:hypothetical protein MVEN_02532300 [Mycena venus]|uniref:DUF6535 domain-containing protein n=1 Tax=Mycena venus TaxID=2733690 RepID=A0A8H7CAC6_9AGAR|nr:hypothetical protein MVEN_02532300 [Mycena venus]